MSLITSCPACGTMFRVVPDQLKISEGWVRCGHCAEVFDATAHLGDEAGLHAGMAAGAPLPASASAAGSAVPRPHPQPQPHPHPHPHPHPQAQPQLQPQPLADEAIRGWESTAGAPLVSLPAALAPTPPAPADRARSFAPDSELEPSSLDAPFVFRRSDLVDHDALPSVMPPAPVDSRLQDDDLPSRDDEPSPELEQVSFVRHARRKAFWRRPLVRVFSMLLCLLLAATLVLQAAYHERDRIAALQPALVPALQEMCVHLQCTLGQPRQIEAILIDSSGFNRLRGDTYRLAFNVRNTAGTRVAAPSLELTLTDSQDQPLLRRVLTPQELGQAGGSIAAGAEWSGTAGVVVSPGNAGRIAGYRLLAFYP